MYSSSVSEGLTLTNWGGAKFRIWGGLVPKPPMASPLGIASPKNYEEPGCCYDFLSHSLYPYFRFDNCVFWTRSIFSLRTLI